MLFNLNKRLEYLVSQTYRDCVLQLLRVAAVGGSDCRSTTRGVLRLLIGRPLAIAITWKGNDGRTRLCEQTVLYCLLLGKLLNQIGYEAQHWLMCFNCVTV